MKLIPQVHLEEVQKENAKVNLVVNTDPYCWWHVITPQTHPCRLMRGATGSHSGGRKVTVFVFFIRIGVLCAYAANQNLSSQVKNIRRLVNSNMRDLHTFANDTPMVRHEFFHATSGLQSFPHEISVQASVACTWQWFENKHPTQCLVCSALYIYEDLCYYFGHFLHFMLTKSMKLKLRYTTSECLMVSVTRLMKIIFTCFHL